MIGIWLLATCSVNQTNISKFATTPVLAPSLAKDSFSAALVGSALFLQINDTTHAIISTPKLPRALGVIHINNKSTFCVAAKSY